MTALLVIALFYFTFRHFMLVLVIMDAVLGILKQFRWFPDEGKRMRTFKHWLGAFAFVVASFVILRVSGLVEFVPVSR